MQTTIWFADNTHVHRFTLDWEDAKTLFCLLAHVQSDSVRWDWFGPTLRAYDPATSCPDCEPPFRLIGIIERKEARKNPSHRGPVRPPLPPDPQDRRLPTPAPRPPVRF